MSKERFREYLRILKRVALITLIIIIADAIGLSILLFAQGRLQNFNFMESLIVLLLFEGCIIGAAGGFMYIGIGTIWGTRPGARDSTPTQEAQKSWKERNESQQRWTISMVAVGLLMILIAFLTSSIAQI